MKDINYTITFFSDWHCGSGLSAGSESDTLVKKNKEGLPYVPGRTIKGLLKDAARDLFEVDADYLKFIEACFGKKSENDENISDNKFFYSNAEFSSPLTEYFKPKPIEKAKLFRNISSTRIIEKTGVAKKQSLRTIEVSIPVMVIGAILNIPNDYRDKMIDCMRMVKRLGSNRNRGLGRCRFDVTNPQEGGQQ